ncbi:hypothetical protein [Legionella sp.]|uniref:hypothetical protein n=1 Tax=Legionella sp. TaxID=459 RepID=UPI003CB16766
MNREKYTNGTLNNTGLTDPSIGQTCQLSLKDYKIDYNKCLGKGVYGSVFRVVLRPENEKGFWSSWFPYLYDYIYPVNSKPIDERSKKYCIKIFKPAIQVLYENINHPLPLRYPIESFYVHSEELKTNQILCKHGISGITFFNSASRYSQLKTRVRGKTLRFYLDKGYFIDPEQFELRESFVNFLRPLYKSNLVFCDIHSKNLMYDKYRHCWEIIDGSAMEILPDGLVDIGYDEASSLVDRLTRCENDGIKEIFEILDQTAKANLEYTLGQDKELFEHLKPLNTTHL